MKYPTTRSRSGPRWAWAAGGVIRARVRAAATDRTVQRLDMRHLEFGRVPSRKRTLSTVGPWSRPCPYVGSRWLAGPRAYDRTVPDRRTAGRARRPLRAARPHPVAGPAARVGLAV